MQADAIQPGQNVIIIDDLIATGSTTCHLHKIILTRLNRRIGDGSGPTRRSARRKDHRVSLHHRTDVPQGGFQTRCASVLNSSIRRLDGGFKSILLNYLDRYMHALNHQPRIR